ncbi:CAAX amino terminal protease family protein [Lentilactobacillus kisonensis DSM 19906 = JCM 15041]|uniref:CAAX amino terminal protease family protein n=3 Tax=Lentilactobacillus kisonensis TaxID=481722 RepID=H1LIB3_9LACO|nr:CAAX amino terminal protease family protein [Lentilactobacillus kisonensis F0435]KRL19376.1 CAAX amino terminal protease family protein [Lentilactobacillus kisonensis DSM 19906 = JCM 15041]
MEFVSAVILIICYLCTDLVLKGTTPFVHASFRLLFALIISGIIYYILRTAKVRADPIKYSRAAKIWGIIFLVVFLILFLLLDPIPRQVLAVFHSHTFIADTMMALSAGFAEEFLFRGLLLSTFMRVFRNNALKYTFSACASALCFGSMHLANLVNGQLLIPTIQQAIYAFVLGVMLASIRITTNTMTWTVLAHFLLDWQAGLSVNTHMDGTTPWLLFFIVWGIILIITVIFLITYDHSADRTRSLNFNGTHF